MTIQDGKQGREVPLENSKQESGKAQVNQEQPSNNPETAVAVSPNVAKDTLVAKTESPLEAATEQAATMAKVATSEQPVVSALSAIPEQTASPEQAAALEQTASPTSPTEAANEALSTEAVPSTNETPVEMPNAVVGMIEHEGIQIEMLSLSKLRELAQAEAEAKANAPKKTRKRRTVKSTEDGETAAKPKRQRKTKAKKAEENATEKPKASTQDGEAADLSLNVLESADLSEQALDVAHATAHSPEDGQASVAQSAESTASSDLEAQKNPNAYAGESTPNFAQSLLSKIISNVEDQEVKAAQVNDEEVEKEAAAAVETAILEQQQKAESEAPQESVFADTEWADMEELTPEQIERYSHMGLKEGDICPVCMNGILMMRHTYKSDFLGCSNYPNCKFHLFTGKRSAVVTLRELNVLCPKCKGQLEVKKGRFGIFIGCSNYPACTYVHHREDVAPVVNIVCPVCKKGNLVARRGRSGKTFYGCDNYPACDFSVFGEPVQQVCEDCGFPVMYKKKVKKGVALICGNSKCPSQKKKTYKLLEERKD